MSCNMQDNASGIGNGCDLLHHYENCPHELPGTCTYSSSTTEPSQALFLYIFFLHAPCGIVISIYSQTWWRRPGWGTQGYQEHPSAKQSSNWLSPGKRESSHQRNPPFSGCHRLLLASEVQFPPDFWCVGILNSFFTAGCHLSGVPVWAAQPYQCTLKAGWHQTQICPALIRQAQWLIKIAHKWQLFINNSNYVRLSLILAGWTLGWLLHMKRPYCQFCDWRLFSGRYILAIRPCLCTMRLSPEVITQTARSAEHCKAL